MKKIINNLLIASSLLTVAACDGSVRDNLGLRKSSPNEFTVVANPPLSLPPEFSLRPPVDGIVSLEEDIPKEARKVLFEQVAYSSKDNKSKSESVFSKNFGASPENLQIKSILIEDELASAKVAEKKGMFDKIASFSLLGNGVNSSSVVDAKLEKERITNNIKEGEQITAGETPTLDSSDGDKALLDRILGR